MTSDARWIKILVGRVWANAIVGGILLGFVGALCLGVVGALILPTMGLLNRAFPNPFSNGVLISPEPPSPVSCLLLFSGASTGLIIGGLTGIVIFGVAAIQAPPGRFFAPILTLIWRVVLGQLVGTLSALTLFGAFAVFQTQVQKQSLLNNTTGGFNDIYLNAIALGAPILMICGAITGALSKRDVPETATLKSR